MSEGVWAVRKIPFVTAETAPTGHPNKLLLNGSTVFWSSCSQLLFSVNVWWLLLAFVVEIASVGRAFVSLTLACEIFFLTGVKFLDVSSSGDTHSESSIYTTTVVSLPR
ncbi:MAG: uncharacterized protein KVP18_003201 [Porospora cf. gigantea A]|uniref:uncharacterized protein n=1 Tax=Porospora cf. gigantea A TaxID=2853593 RepID=UPI00355A6E13|nr:MAG: hypothetical protein KVP18_003201 [Porospora cf. gigantea A]